MNIDKNFYTSHINDSEKLIGINRLLDKIQLVLNSHTIQHTDFLDPYEIYLSKSLLNRFDDITYKIIGGYEGAERNILIIFPAYLQSEIIGEEISGIEINNIGEGLIHRDFLGSILNLGIKREKIGDILVHDNSAHIIVKSEIGDFIIYNLERIKNKVVDVSEIPLNKIEAPVVKFKDITISVSSLRLDAIISGVHNLSRGKSIGLIESQEVKVNWENIKRPSTEIKVGDVISVRKHGRIILQEISGYSKRGKLRCIVRILI